MDKPTWGNRIKLNAKNGDVENLMDPYYDSEVQATEAAQNISRQVRNGSASISTLSQKVNFSIKDYRSVEVYKIENDDTAAIFAGVARDI
jgi:Glu-tRNA(Gln) amidotransferase subunit E-like FAD-binding protein